MTKRYVEVTIAYEDDPALNPSNVVEEFHRSKEDGGDWSNLSEMQNCALTSILGLDWVELKIKKV